MKIIGKNSLISKHIEKVKQGVTLIETHKILNLDFNNFFNEGDTIVYMSSVLRSKRLEDQTKSEWTESFLINTVIPVKIIKFLNNNITNFTFCYVGSESAFKGSFDDTYFLSKSSTQKFIETFRLKSENSRIFTIAPSTILSGMTLRRSDTARLEEYRLKMRNKRFMTLEEISNIIISLCSTDFNYLSNETININFGKFASYE
jgi:NAD(P)-dependent dehydrogenase (short-subunit alcohol dehydrogenase family)